MTQGLKDAIAVAGGLTRAAALIDVTPQRMCNWLDRGPPAEMCPVIERATGTPVEDLRPDLQWIRVEDPTWPDGRPCLDVAAAA
jgi:DNA-binding transcriptional regulator YdaS (Cro superfamily)